MKKICKYATGDEVPEGAEYLGTIKNGTRAAYNNRQENGGMQHVWHYFLVEVTE